MHNKLVGKRKMFLRKQHQWRAFVIKHILAHSMSFNPLSINLTEPYVQATDALVCFISVLPVMFLTSSTVMLGAISGHIS